MPPTTPSQEVSSPRGFLSPKPAAVYLDRCRSFLDKKMRSGELPYYKLGCRNVLIKIEDLDKFMEQFRVDPSKPAPFENPSRRRGKNGEFSKQEGGRA